MHWTQPATADDSHAAIEKTLWDAANQLLAGAKLKPSEYSPTVHGQERVTDTARLARLNLASTD